MRQLDVTVNASAYGSGQFCVSFQATSWPALLPEPPQPGDWNSESRDKDCAARRSWHSRARLAYTFHLLELSRQAFGSFSRLSQ